MLLQKVQKLEVVIVIIVGVTNVKCFCNVIAKLGDDAILQTGSACLRHCVSTCNYRLPFPTVGGIIT